MVLFELLFHGILDLVWILQVHGHHPQGVADEIDGEVVLLDPGEAREDRALFWIFDVALKRDHALRFHGLGQQEQQRQQVAVVRWLPFRTAENLAQAAAGCLDHGQGVGDQKRCDTRAADSRHFVRCGMQDHADVPARQDVAAEHHGEQHDDADDLEHELSRGQASLTIAVNV